MNFKKSICAVLFLAVVICSIPDVSMALLTDKKQGKWSLVGKAKTQATIRTIDIKTQVHGFGVLPGDVERHFGNLLHAVFVDIVHGEDRRTSLASYLHARPRHLPATDANLN